MKYNCKIKGSNNDTFELVSALELKQYQHFNYLDNEYAISSIDEINFDSEGYLDNIDISVIKL